MEDGVETGMGDDDEEMGRERRRAGQEQEQADEEEGASFFAVPQERVARKPTCNRETLSEPWPGRQKERASGGRTYKRPAKPRAEFRGEARGRGEAHKKRGEHAEQEQGKQEAEPPIGSNTSRAHLAEQGPT